MSPKATEPAMRSCASVLIIFFSFCSAANAEEFDKALHIDQQVPPQTVLAFPNDDKIRPEVSGFEIVDTVLMSSEYGQRWAVLTLRNPSTGTRIFEQKYVMALLADGRRLQPQPISETFEGGESLSLTLNFGVQQFPILRIYLRD